MALLQRHCCPHGQWLCENRAAFASKKPLQGIAPFLVDKLHLSSWTDDRIWMASFRFISVATRRCYLVDSWYAPMEQPCKNIGRGTTVHGAYLQMMSTCTKDKPLPAWSTVYDYIQRDKSLAISLWLLTCLACPHWSWRDEYHGVLGLGMVSGVQAAIPLYMRTKALALAFGLQHIIRSGRELV